MINQYHNYIFCTEEAMKDITSIQSFSKFNGRYDEYVIGTNKEAKTFLVIFNTRLTYSLDVIYEYIRKYTDTNWIRVNNEETIEEVFYYDNNDVCMIERPLVYGLDRKEICIRYSVDNIAPIMNIFVSDKEIVVERYLKNKSETIQLTKAQSRKILSYVEMIVSTTVQRRKGFYKYYLPTKRDLVTEIKVFWDGWHFEFVPTWNPEIRKNLVICGESLFERLKKYVFPMIPSFEDWGNNNIDEMLIDALMDDGEMNRQ